MGNLKACQKCGKVMDEESQFYLRKDRNPHGFMQKMFNYAYRQF